MNDSPFKAIQDAQEIEREGWMPDPVAELNQRLELAERELRDAGYTHAEGAPRWKPPVNEEMGKLWKRLFTAEDAIIDKDAEIDRLKKELGEARKDAERLYLSIKDIEEPTYHELDIMKQHEALTGKPLSFG